MEEVIQDKCGFIVGHTCDDVWVGLNGLQHRGREMTGIGGIGPNGIDVVKYFGSVRKFDRMTVSSLLPGRNYHTFFGHVRYITRGDKSAQTSRQKLLSDGHPVVVGGDVHFRGDHMIVRGADSAIVWNGQVNDHYPADISEKIRNSENAMMSVDENGRTHYFDSLDTAVQEYYGDSIKLLSLFCSTGIEQILKTIPGSYSGAIASKKHDQVIVFRDRTGLMPGAVGKKSEKFIFASEDCALEALGGKYLRDMEPGSYYSLLPCGDMNGPFNIVSPVERHCKFQWEYVSKHDSRMADVDVRALRYAVGVQLAKEFPIPQGVRYVSFVPRCPIDAALGFEKESGLELIDLFYKLRGERSFIGGNGSERSYSIRSNLHIEDREDILSRVRGQYVLFIDDSTIRGNVANRVRELCEPEGIKPILLVYSPKIGVYEEGVAHGCMFGVDMPPEDNFLVRETFFGRHKNRPDNEINIIAGMQVYFMSREGSLKVFEEMGLPKDKLCYFCQGGPFPYIIKQ